ncbi:MAG TPA: methyltransferase domain-containing protein [Burkholderiales bacterium]
MNASGYGLAPFIAEFYDHVPRYATRADVDFYVKAAAESAGPVLEFGCGTGRILIPTARAGIEIAGLDAAAAMLAACRRRLEAELPEVQARVGLHHGDMRRFEFQRRFRLVTIPFRPFQHLVTDEEPSFTLPDGRTVVRRHRMLERDLINQVNTGELVYYVRHADGREERLVHALRMRCTFRFEAEHLLARAGFTLEHVYSDFDRSPYGKEYPGELIFVARRTD